MNKRLARMIMLFALLLTIGLPSPATAQNKRWREIKGKSLVQFDSNCASPSAYPSAKLNRIVRATMKRKGFVGYVTSGDRAFMFDLNSDNKPEYFIPLYCGATGNCTWGVFALSPARLLGLLGGQYIYAHKRAGRYPKLITYTHRSAPAGILRTYSFRNKRYSWLGDEYPTEVRGGIYGNKIPDFLDKARSGCKSLGY
jgi:hypothetical protein